ncbi:hypothetical protein D3C83_248930 [compost metagenome]
MSPDQCLANFTALAAICANTMSSTSFVGIAPAPMKIAPSRSRTSHASGVPSGGFIARHDHFATFRTAMW